VRLLGPYLLKRASRNYRIALVPLAPPELCDSVDLFL
jgi:hypothetical protein